MFSGGRDSTIAAVRLSRSYDKVCLVTVTSDHLVGIEAVHRRLEELSDRLPTGSEWYHVVQPETVSLGRVAAANADSDTCLPCHRDYTAIAASLAPRLAATSLAFGYAGYQSTWPEQTPEAIRRLREILRSSHLHLLVPVYDLSSKEEAIAELQMYGLSTESLEQKCQRQRPSEELPERTLISELDRWEADLRRDLMNSTECDIPILERRELGSARNENAAGS